MFGFFSRKKKLHPSGIRTIPIADLAPLWRDPNEGVDTDAKAADINGDDAQKGLPNSKLPGMAGSKHRGTKPKSEPAGFGPANGTAPWFDEQATVGHFENPFKSRSHLGFPIQWKGILHP
jgi:hypothetical protein